MPTGRRASRPPRRAVTTRADELDGYAPGASALIVAGEDGQVQTRELTHPEDPTQAAWYLWITVEGDVVRVLCPLQRIADHRRDLGHRICNDYNALPRWPRLYFSEPRADGRWGWRADRVAELLAQPTDGPLFFAGCSEEQIDLPFNYRVLLTMPEDVLVERLRTRTSNTYGREGTELEQVLGDLAQIEPLLRRSADLVLTTIVAPAQVDLLLQRLAE